MITVGIDQSYTKTGIVVLDDGDGNPMLDYTVISSDAKLPYWARAGAIADKVSEFILGFEHRWLDYESDPVIVGVEGLSFGSKGNQTRNLAGLLFLIHDRLAPMHTPREIAISTLKKFATGNGRADKTEMVEHLPPNIKEVFMKIPKTKGREDLADAYWIARYLQEH